MWVSKKKKKVLKLKYTRIFVRSNVNALSNQLNAPLTINKHIKRRVRLIYALRAYI